MRKYLSLFSITWLVILACVKIIPTSRAAELESFELNCSCASNVSSVFSGAPLSAHNSTVASMPNSVKLSQDNATLDDTMKWVAPQETCGVQDGSVLGTEESLKPSEESYVSLEKWRDRVYLDIEREKKKDDNCIEPESEQSREPTVVVPSRSVQVENNKNEATLNCTTDISLHEYSTESPVYSLMETSRDNTSVNLSLEYAPDKLNHTSTLNLDPIVESNSVHDMTTCKSEKFPNKGWHVYHSWFVNLLQLVKTIGFRLLRKFSYEPSETVSQDGFNFASVDAGARILAANKGSTGAKNILHEDKDKYMLSPCRHKRWVVIELSEEILLKRVEIANFEYFSSFPENLVLLGSQRFPTDKWILLQVAPFNQSRDIQYFELRDDTFIRYLKILFVGVQGKEFFCTISLVKVFGKRLVDDWKEALEQSNRDRHVAAEVIAGASLKKPILVSNESGLDKRCNTRECLPNGSRVSVDEMESKYNCINQTCSRSFSDFAIIPETLQKEHNDSFQNISAFSEAVEESIFRQLTRMLRQLELNQTLVSQYVDLHLAQYAASLSDAKREALVARQESEKLQQRLEKLEEAATCGKFMRWFGILLIVYFMGLFSAFPYFHENILSFQQVLGLMKARWKRLFEKRSSDDQTCSDAFSRRVVNNTRECRSQSTGQLLSFST